MKKKLFLLPVTLTTLSPMISMVGCGCHKPLSNYIEVNEYQHKIDDDDIAWLVSPRFSAHVGDELKFHISFDNWITNSKPSYIFIDKTYESYLGKDFQENLFKIGDGQLVRDTDYEFNDRQNYIEITSWDNREFNVEDDWTLHLTIKEEVDDCSLFIFAGW